MHKRGYVKATPMIFYFHKRRINLERSINLSIIDALNAYIGITEEFDFIPSTIKSHIHIYLKSYDLSHKRRIAF